MAGCVASLCGNTSLTNGGGGLRAEGHLTLTHSAVISSVAAASLAGKRR